MTLIGDLRKAATLPVRALGRVLAEKYPWGYLSSPWMVPVSWNIRDYLKSYGEIGWLFGCVSRIGQAVGDAELQLFVRRGDKEKDRERLYKHPILDLLDYVNPFQTGYEFMMLTQIYLDLVGRCYWYVVNNGLNVPVELWIIPPSYMRPVPDRENFLKGWMFEAGTERIPFELSEIIYLKNPDPDNPYGGLGAAQSIGVDLQTEQFSGQWNRNYFYNDAAVGTIISYPEELSDTEYDRVSEQFKARHQGIGRAHKVAVLSGGAKIEKSVISQRDMDFWKLRKLNRDNILGAFGMPLSVMGVSENVNRANAESGEYVFARWTIKPRLKLISSKLTEQLCSRYDPKLECEYADPVPENKEMLLKEANQGLNAGYMTINESRRTTGLDPIDGGEVLLLPSNKVPVRLENDKLPEHLPQPMNVLSMPEHNVKEISGNGHRQFESEEQREAHWQQWSDKALKEERSIIAKLREMFTSQLKEALGNLSSGGGEDQKLIDLKKAKEDFTAAVTEELTKLVREALEDAEDLVAPENPHTESYVRIGDKTGGHSPLHSEEDLMTKQEENPPAFDEALRWLKTRIGWAADEVGDETASLLADQLAAGFAEGESMPEIAKRVRQTFVHCDKVRSVRIARTETIMASNEAALIGYEEVDVKRAQFYAALDERTCRECMGLHEDTFKLEDAHGMIPLHPNCRCTFLPIVED